MPMCRPQARSKTSTSASSRASILSDGSSLTAAPSLVFRLVAVQAEADPRTTWTQRVPAGADRLARACLRSSRPEVDPRVLVDRQRPALARRGEATSRSGRRRSAAANAFCS